MYVRKQLVEKTPDVVINVIDTSNLERNLYLTTELIDMHLRMVCALNMFDETEKRGDNVDYNKLGQLFGVPMVPTVFKSGKGVEMLFHIIINIYEGVDYLDDKGNLNPEVATDIANWHKQFATDTDTAHPEDFAAGDRPKGNVYRHIHINHGKYVEEGITAVQQVIKQQESLREHYSTRYLAIKMLENDKDVQRIIDTLNATEHNRACLNRRNRHVKRAMTAIIASVIVSAMTTVILLALSSLGIIPVT